MPPSLHQALAKAPLVPTLLSTKTEAAITNESAHTWREQSQPSI